MESMERIKRMFNKNVVSANSIPSACKIIRNIRKSYRVLSTRRIIIPWEKDYNIRDIQ